MARQVHNRDIAPVLAAAEQWINICLIEDGSALSNKSLWTDSLVNEVYQAFVKHPDYGADDFMTKLKGQMASASASAQQLMAEMLWALLLSPSNMKARTKAQQVRTLWAMAGESLPDHLPLLEDEVLAGIGSGGPGFNNYRPNELEFLIELTRDLKAKAIPERRHVLTDYDTFVGWIDSVHREGSRQFRHMLRFFAFPDRVERISSNNDRRKILAGLGVASRSEVRNWSDRELDDALFKLRVELERSDQGGRLDFYSPALKERWAEDRKVKTPEGEVTVVVPSDDEEGNYSPLCGVVTRV
jgi:5-methylcytosine-specific restriction enzyme B